MSKQGPLDGINLRLDKNQGENLKKMVDAAKAILDSIGTSTSSKESIK